MNDAEKKARKALFDEMSASERFDYIFTYYKIPIFAVILAVIILFSFVHRQLNAKKPVLCEGWINVSFGEDLSASLREGFLRDTGHNLRKEEVLCYEALYLSDDADTLNHQYAYASRMKLTASVSDKMLDIVIMNREAYDILSRSGYLLPLPAFLEDRPELAGSLTSYYSENEVITEDNSIEYQLRETEELIVTTRTETNAVVLNDIPLFKDAGFDGDVYLGIIANTPRTEAAAEYLSWMLQAAA